MKYFGTDGIRGIAGIDLTGALIGKVGYALAMKKDNCRILVSIDTRISSCFYLSLFAGGAEEGGATLDYIGVATTPSVSYLTKTLSYDYGVMLTASHNPFYYNGIKLFDSFGKKLAIEEEAIIEELMEKAPGCFIPKRVTANKALLSCYRERLIGGEKLHNTGILVDAAYGGAGELAHYAVNSLFDNGFAINAALNRGEMINEGVGALYPEYLIKKVNEYGSGLGVALDGDADRILVADSEKAYDGDDILYILARELKRRNKLTNNGIAITPMSNGALIQCLNEEGIVCHIAEVGDSNVSRMMKEYGLVLGGEQSGHILTEEASISDGLFVGITIARILERGFTLKELALPYKLPQLTINIAVHDKERFFTEEKTQKMLSVLKSLLNNRGRVLIRSSGTENKIRIMAEAENQELLNEAKKLIEESL